MTSKFERLILATPLFKQIPEFYYYRETITGATLFQIFKKKLALIHHPTKGHILIVLPEARKDAWMRTQEEGLEPSTKELEQYYR